MKCTEFEFGVGGGELLFGREWQPKSKPQGVICLVHGLGEHGGRYVNMAEKLTEAGYVLLTFDQRGHGKSLGRRGYTSSYDTLIDDIDCFRRESLKRFPKLPTFLYGHSMGGNLVLNYVLRRKANLSGVIVTSPWLRLTVEPPGLLKVFLRFLNKLWPTLSLSNGLDVKSLSHDLKIVNAYKDDPLVHDRITVRLILEMDQAARWAMKNADQFRLPLLLMHGGGDRITSPEASQEFAAQIMKGCTLKLWPGLFHELHNEHEKDEILVYIINWLKQHQA